MIVQYRWIQIQMETIQYGWIQIDKLFNFIWNSRFDRWIDCIHDCIHDSIIQMDKDTDTDGYIYNIDGYRWINCLISCGTPDLMDGQIAAMIVQYRWIQILSLIRTI